MATNGNNIIIGTMSGTTFTAFAAVKSHDVQTSAEAIEIASDTNQDWKEFIAGRKEWGINVSYLVLQDANSNIEDLLKSGNVYAIRIKGRTGNYKLSGNALCLQCKQSYTRGNLSVGNYSFKGVGPLVNT